VIFEEPSERAIAEAAGTKAAPQPSSSGVLVSEETSFEEVEEELFFAPPVRRLRASSIAPPSASAGFLGAPFAASVEFKRRSASCQKARPESQVSWKSLDEGAEEEVEEEVEVEALLLFSPPEEEANVGTLVSPSPKASSGSLVVRSAFPDSRSTSLTVDFPLRPGFGMEERERGRRGKRERGRRGKRKRGVRRRREREQVKKERRKEKEKKRGKKKKTHLSTPRGRPCNHRRRPKRAVPRRFGRTPGPA